MAHPEHPDDRRAHPSADGPVSVRPADGAGRHSGEPGDGADTAPLRSGPHPDGTGRPPSASPLNGAGRHQAGPANGTNGTPRADADPRPPQPDPRRLDAWDPASQPVRPWTPNNGPANDAGADRPASNGAGPNDAGPYGLGPREAGRRGTGSYDLGPAGSGPGGVRPADTGADDAARNAARNAARRPAPGSGGQQAPGGSPEPSAAARTDAVGPVEPRTEPLRAGDPSAVPPGPAPVPAPPAAPRPSAPVPAGERKPLDPDATVTFGKVDQADGPPAADDFDRELDEAVEPPDAAAERPSRRTRREAGRAAGGRPAADYKKQAEALSRKRPRTGRRRRPAFWRELPMLVVVALVLTFLIQTFLAKVYVIPSGSMETTLHGCNGCNNDRVLVDKVSYRFGDPQPGDVVVFRGPDSWNSEVQFAPPSNAFVGGLQQLGSLVGIAPPDEKDFVKRVIAVGGQTVQCCDSRNRVLVDGQPLEEPYVYYLPEAGAPRQEPFGPVTVPDGQLWMMGDSRNNSSDSRVPDHGPVPVENVIGIARLIVLPVARFGWIDSIDPHPTTAVGLAPLGADAPLALGALFVVPLAFRRRRRLDAVDEFLPDRSRWR